MDVFTAWVRKQIEKETLKVKEEKLKVKEEPLTEGDKIILLSGEPPLSLASKIFELEEKLKVKDEYIESLQNNDLLQKFFCTNAKDILIRNYCKLLKKTGINIGQNKLFEWFRENKYLMPNNMPYEKYKKYFEVYQQEIANDWKYTTKITPQGQVYFLSKLGGSK